MADINQFRAQWERQFRTTIGREPTEADFQASLKAYYEQQNAARAAESQTTVAAPPPAPAIQSPLSAPAPADAVPAVIEQPAEETPAPASATAASAELAPVSETAVAPVTESLPAPTATSELAPIDETEVVPAESVEQEPVAAQVAPAELAAETTTLEPQAPQAEFTPPQSEAPEPSLNTASNPTFAAAAATAPAPAASPLAGLDSELATGFPKFSFAELKEAVKNLTRGDFSSEKIMLMAVAVLAGLLILKKFWLLKLPFQLFMYDRIALASGYIIASILFLILMVFIIFFNLAALTKPSKKLIAQVSLGSIGAVVIGTVANVVLALIGYAISYHPAFVTPLELGLQATGKLGLVLVVIAACLVVLTRDQVKGAFQSRPKAQPAPGVPVPTAPGAMPVAAGSPVQSQTPGMQTQQAGGYAEPVAPGAFRTDRSLLIYFILTFFTFGIFHLLAMSEVSSTIDKIAYRYDNRRTMHYALVFILSPFTLGFLTLYWFHTISDRIGAEAARRGAPNMLSNGDFWLWGFLGTIIIIGPLVYIHKLAQAMNYICDSYNKTGA